MLNGMGNHVGVEVTPGAGVHLPDRYSGRGNPHGIVVGLLVPLDDGESELFAHVPEGPLQNRRLTGTGRTDQIQDEDSLLRKEGTVRRGKPVVLRQNVAFDTDFPAGWLLFVPVPVFMLVNLPVMIVLVRMHVIVIVIVVVVVGVIVIMVMVMIVMMVLLGAAAACYAHKVYSTSSSFTRNSSPDMIPTRYSPQDGQGS
jgi:hypothetical protein